MSHIHTINYAKRKKLNYIRHKTHQIILGSGNGAASEWKRQLKTNNQKRMGNGVLWLHAN